MAAGIGVVLAQESDLTGPGPDLAPGALEALDRPVLLLEGAESPTVVAEIQAALAARLPRARRVVLPGAGHMAPMTHPEAVARVLSAHLAACGPAG
jgi:pimeloyl-ACP methyl ester carboxylesterase